MENVNINLLSKLSVKFIKESPEAVSGIESDLNVLIEEYGFQSLYADLLAYAIEFFVDSMIIEGSQSFGERKHTESKELISALNFLFDNAGESVKIDFKHKSINSKVSVNNQELIQVIKNALLSHFVENNFQINQGWIDPDKITEWGKFVKFMYNEESNRRKNRGRTNKYFFTGKHIEILQKYLQDHTELKSDSSISISRSQARFIFKFLNIIETFEGKLSWEEDNIRHILAKHKSKIAEKKFSSPEEMIQRCFEKEKEFKVKFQAFSKK